MALGTPIIPQVITVHLGTPKSNARNVTLPFKEYIKNMIYINHRTDLKRPIYKDYTTCPS